jgi:hypothetical protein
MQDGNHWLMLKVAGLEVAAHGWLGIAALVLLVALVLSGLVMGWWHLPR